jgi:signal transduction histidine kinase
VGWLGLLFVQQGQVRLREQARGLAEQRLGELNQQIRDLVERQSQDLSEALAATPLTAEGVRRFVRGHRLVHQAFILDNDGRLIHPDTTAPLSHDELAFLERTRPIWESGESFYATHDGTEGDVQEQGWYTWYWGEGLHLIFWRHREGSVIGCEVERAALLADMIGQLPSDTPSGAYASKIGRLAGTARLLPAAPVLSSRTTLADTQNRTLYQWGERAVSDDELPFASLPICAPLEAWSWRFYTTPIAIDRLGRTAIFNVTAGTGLLLVTLAGMAILLHRESTRQTREAEQRVSFVNRVSHELKTPLTNIQMFTELLNQRLDSDDETAQRYSHIVMDESERLGRLIKNVLTYARQARKSFEIERRPCDIGEVIARVTQLFRPSLQEAGLALALTPAATAIGEVMADPDAISQIVGNLLSNAEKHAKRASTVRIAVAQAAHTTTIVVEDDGPGIPTRAHKAVFRPFYRLGNQTNEGSSGTGIGLAISRELARLHGGDLTLTHADNGARFTLKLETPPAAREHA